MKKHFDLQDDFTNIITQFVNAKTISEISTGWTNFVFKVFDGKTYYIFRFPRDKFWSKVIVKEYKFNKIIHNQLSIPTSKMFLKKYKGKYFSFHRMIDGDTLQNKFPMLSLAEKKNIAKQIANFLSEFQKLDIKTLNKSIKLQKTSLFLKKLSKMEQCKYDLSQHKNLVSLEKESAHSQNLVLCHGDFNASNVLIDKYNNVCAILDFAFISISNSATDIARICGRLNDSFFENALCTEFKNLSSTFSIVAVEKIKQVYNYVDKKYIDYIKQNHPEIIV